MESKNNILLLTYVIICSFFFSCASGDDEGLRSIVDYDSRVDVSHQEYTARLCLNVIKEDFDKANNMKDTRSTSYEWEDGDKLYLILTSGAKTVSGTATYSITDDWVLKFNGLLTRDQKTKAKVFYFTNVNNEDNYSLDIDVTCGVFRDEDGSYFYPSGSTEITINAILKPITGRLKFKGDSTSVYNIDGITYFSNFSLNSGDFSVTSEPLFDLQIQDCLYGYFENSTNRHIRVKSGEYLYSADCPEGFLQIGKSGYIDIPTHESHNGWIEKQVGGLIKVKDINGDSVYVNWIDLGLPSGLKWAEEDFGFFDESTAHEDYDTDQYTDCARLPWGATWFSDRGKTNNYSSSTTDISGTSNDPIWLSYGKKCRLPKLSEFQELVDYLDWKKQYCKNKNGETDFYGVLGCCKSNLTHIVLYPEGYDIWDFKEWTAENDEYNVSGYYWTSTPSSSSKAYCFKFTEEYPMPQKMVATKGYGMLMHPVIDK